jgi:hypothetical protein
MTLPRKLIGAFAVVGLVAIIAGCDVDTVTAQCVQDENGQQVIVADEYCTDHTINDTGYFVWGGHQYRYYYGSTGPLGSRPRGGTTSPPEEDENGYTPNVKTGSGKTITRGGLGGTGSGKTSGG